MQFSRLLLVSAVVSALVLSACSPGSDTDTPAGSDADSDSSDTSDTDADNDADDSGDGGLASGEGVVVYNNGPNDSLDPLTPVNGNSYAMGPLMAVYDRLLDFDEAGELIPSLAETWEFTDADLTEFRLTLRDGINFHDGTPFDAEAVVANLERSRDTAPTASPAVQASALLLESIQAMDDRTVTINLSGPRSSLPYDLAGYLGMMISPASIEGGASGADLDAVGTGPYTLESLTPNATTRLERWDDYWGGGVQERAATLQFDYIVDSQTSLNALRSGQADLVLLDVAQVSQATEAGLDIIAQPTLGVQTNYLNTSGPLEDVRVRQALSYAIDRSAIAESPLGEGYAEPVNQLFPPGQGAFSDELADMYAYDPQRAEELLAEAGYEDGITLDFVQLNLDEQRTLFEALQDMWSAVGIEMNVTSIDIAEFGRFVDGSLGDLMLAGWGGRPDPLTTLELVVGPEGTFAPSGAVSPELAEAIERAGSFPPGDESRESALQEANAIAVTEAANVVVMTRPSLFASKSNCIAGFEPFPAAVSGNFNNVVKTDSCD